MSHLALLYLIAGLIALIGVPFMANVLLGAMLAFIAALCLLCFLVIDMGGIR